MPNKLWERVKLPRNYEKALEIIDKHLMYWPKFLVHKTKQRLTKLTQMRIRMRKLALKTREKIMTIPKKVETRDRRRMEKAEKAAMIDKSIENELLKRLEKGVYGDIHNSVKEYNKLPDDIEVKDVAIEHEEDDEVEIEYVEGYEELEEEDDMEDFGRLAIGQGAADDDNAFNVTGGSDEDDELIVAMNRKRERKDSAFGGKRLDSHGLNVKSEKKPRVLVEVEHDRPDQRKMAITHLKIFGKLTCKAKQQLSQTSMEIPTVALHSTSDHLSIPVIGMGTAVARQNYDLATIKEAIVEAIKAGYRHFDTAVNKEDLLPMDFKSVWADMEECQRLGLTKSIGVCNFSCKKLEDLLSHATIPPAINQVEMSPVWQQKKLRDLCAANNITVTAYSPLGAVGARWGTTQVMNCQVLQDIARDKGKTVAQVILRWVYEQGVTLLVKSFNNKRMRENLVLEIFSWALSEDDYRKINAIQQSRGMPKYEFISENGPFKSAAELWDGEI
ncbi:hypothetical protein ACET3Z_030348 [Daucus carota]